MSLPNIPTFNHDVLAIHNFVNEALKNENLPSRLQIILMSGILLNNLELITYVCETDKTVVNKPVSNSLMSIIESVINPTEGHSESNIPD